MYLEVPPGILWKIFLNQDLRKISARTFCSGKKSANRPKSNIEAFLVKIFNRELYFTFKKSNKKRAFYCNAKIKASKIKRKES